MAKHCITGSSGRIGRAIYALFSSKGDEVLGLDLIPSLTTDITGDLRDIDILRRAFDGVDTVIHSGALHAPHVGRVSDAEFRSVNVDGTNSVLQAAKASGVKRVVFTSSTAVYGYASQDETRASWITEDTVPQPRTIYHATKLEAERIACEYASKDLPVHIIRMSRCFPEPAQEMAVYRLHRGIDARDVAAAHKAVIEQSSTPFSLHVISGRHPFERADCEELRRDAPAVIRHRAPDLARAFERRGWQLPQSIDRVYVASKAMSELNWAPKFGYEEVLDQLDNSSTEVLEPIT